MTERMASWFMFQALYLIMCALAKQGFVQDKRLARWKKDYINAGGGSLWETEE